MTVLVTVGTLGVLSLLIGVLSVSYVGCYFDIGDSWYTVLQVVCPI